MGKVRDRFGSMGRFKGGLSCKGWVNSVIIIYTLYKVGPEMLLTNSLQIGFSSGKLLGIISFSCLSWKTYV